MIPEIAQSKYISLSTYRKDGSAVATPVWQVPSGDELIVVTEADSWKVKRIRVDSRVQVTVCDVRGRVASGAASSPGTARLMDAAGTARARELLAKRYLMSRVGNWVSRLVRLRRPPMIGIAITLAGSNPVGSGSAG